MPPEKRLGHASCTVKDKLLIFGGKSTLYNVFFNDLFMFETKNNIWT